MTQNPLTCRSPDEAYEIIRKRRERRRPPVIPSPPRKAFQSVIRWYRLWGDERTADLIKLDLERWWELKEMREELEARQL